MFPFAHTHPNLSIICYWYGIIPELRDSKHMCPAVIESLLRFLIRFIEDLDLPFHQIPIL